MINLIKDIKINKTGINKVLIIITKFKMDPIILNKTMVIKDKTIINQIGTPQI